MLYLILFHMGLAYFFGGIAKLNSDWLAGTPMDLYLAARKNYPLGFIYSEQWAPLAFSYGGLLFDLLIIPLLLFRPTRIFGLVCSIFFHVSNILMFGLATFPWFSMLLTSMFFNPSWPRKIPFLQSYVPDQEDVTVKSYNPQLLLTSVLGIYALIHLVLPLRHHLYPGNTSWTEQGHMFSWRMMLRLKQGHVNFYVRKKNEKILKTIDHSVYISKRQYEDMIGNPDLILQFAHFLRDEYRKKLGKDISVYASSKVSLNGRPSMEMIKSGTDLAREKQSLRPYSWINPLIPQREPVLRVFTGATSNK
jgi:hypothetical protein